MILRFEDIPFDTNTGLITNQSFLIALKLEVINRLEKSA